MNSQRPDDRHRFNEGLGIVVAVGHHVDGSEIGFGFIDHRPISRFLDQTVGYGDGSVQKLHAAIASHVAFVEVQELGLQDVRAGIGGDALLINGFCSLQIAPEKGRGLR